MAVQIPTLERISPQAPQASVPINTDVANTAVADKTKIEGISTVANEVNDYQEKVQEHADENTATSLVNNNYEIKVRKRLAEIGRIRGDPRPVYDQFEKDKQQWKEDVLKDYPGASGRLQKLVNEKIATRDILLNDHQATQSGTQYETWTRDNHNGEAILSGQRMYTIISTPDDPDWLAKLHTEVDNMKLNRMKEYDEVGKNYVNPDGSLNLSPNTKAAILKDTTKSLTDSIDVLNRAGRTDDAKKIADEFHNDITLGDKKDLLTKREEAIDKKTALATVARIQATYATPSEQRDALNNDKSLNDNAKQKAREFLGSNITFNEKVDKAEEEGRRDKISKFMRTNMNKWPDLNAFKNDPYIAPQLARLKDQKSVDSLYEQFENPKVSDPKVKNKITNMVMDGSLYRLTPEQLEHELKGTNESFREKTRIKYQSNNTADGSQKNTVLANAHKKMDQIIQSDPEGLGVDVMGTTLDPQAKSQLHEAIDSNLSSLSPEMMAGFKDPVKLNKYVNDFANDLKRNQAFDPEARQKRAEQFRFQGAPTVKKVPPSPVTQNTQNKALPPLSTKQLQQWGAKFYKTTGKAFDPKADDMAAFRKQYGDKL